MNLDKKLVFTSHENGETFINAKTLATVFGKTPAHMRRDIGKTRNDIAELKRTGKFPKLDEAHFYDFYRENRQNGQKYRDILMNKRAFWHVAMRLTGKSATALREMILDQFDEQEAKISQLKKQPLNHLDGRNNQTLLSDNSSLRKNLYKKDKKLNILADNYDRALDKNYYYDNQMATDTLYTVSKMASDYGVSARKFDKGMIQARIFYKKGYDYYVYAKYLADGMVVYRTHSGGNNSVIHFTEEGRKIIFTILAEKYKVTPLGMKGMDFNDFYPFDHTYGEKVRQLILK